MTGHDPTDQLLGWWRNLRGGYGMGSYEAIVPITPSVPPKTIYYFFDRFSFLPKLIFVTHIVIAMIQSAHSEVFF